MNDTSSIDPPPDAGEKRPRITNKPSWKKPNWKAYNQCRTLIDRLGPDLLAELFDSAGLPQPFKSGISADGTGFGSSTYDRYRARLPEPSCGKTRAPAVPYRDIVLSALLRAWWRSSANKAAIVIACPDQPQATDENP